MVKISQYQSIRINDDSDSDESDSDDSSYDDESEEEICVSIKQISINKNLLANAAEKRFPGKPQTLSTTTPPKKYKKKPIPAAVKRIVWNKCIGEHIGKAKCICCKVSDITQLSFHCGHIVSEANGGKVEVPNLRPICQNCNSSMGKMNMDEFIAKYKL